MVMRQLCIHCNRPESDHCPGYEARKLPAGCQCDDGSWGENVTPICEKFEPMGTAGDESYCKHCEHNKACHP